MVKQWNIYGGTVEQRWWNSGTMMVEQWNGDGGTEEQRQWNSEKKRWRNNGTDMEQ